MKIPKQIKGLLNSAVNSPEHIMGMQLMVYELDRLLLEGINYKNPEYWKRVTKKIPFIGGGVTFNDAQELKNYKELTDYLKEGKQLEQVHLDFITGKGIFQDNYDGLKIAIERYIEYIQKKE